MSEPQQPDPTRTVAITGASGLIGSALSRALVERGDQVVHLVRRATDQAGAPAGVREARWDPSAREIDPTALDGVDAVVNLAGPGIGDKRWTQDYKRTLVQARVDGTTVISEAVAARRPLPRLISGSAIGIYGDRGSDVLTEESSTGAGFVAEMCIDWEGATWQAEQAGAPVAHIRTGIVLSREGGAMGRMLPLAKAGLAGPLGSGRQYWAWITLEDVVRALLHLIDDRSITGPVNLTAPQPAPQRDIAKALGDQLNRPSLVPAPAVALRVALGEMADEVLGSRRALPTVLQESGFAFHQPDLEAAMGWLGRQLESDD